MSYTYLVRRFSIVAFSDSDTVSQSEMFAITYRCVVLLVHSLSPTFICCNRNNFPLSSVRVRHYTENVWRASVRAFANPMSAKHPYTIHRHKIRIYTGYLYLLHPHPTSTLSQHIH